MTVVCEAIKDIFSDFQMSAIVPSYSACPIVVSRELLATLPL